MKYIKVERSDTYGSYINPLCEIDIEAELEDIDWLKPGTGVTLTVVGMTEDEYKNLPEFTGW